MDNEISIKSAKGKTFDTCEFSYTSGQAIIVFSDKTFTTLEVYIEYQDDEAIQEGTLEVLSFGNKQLVSLGLFTSEELDVMREKLKKDQKILVEKYQRRQYEQLKKQFG